MIKSDIFFIFATSCFLIFINLVVYRQLYKNLKTVQSVFKYSGFNNDLENAKPGVVRGKLYDRFVLKLFVNKNTADFRGERYPVLYIKYNFKKHEES